ncbi:MafI family immunity protein [Neisseria meningitidis]|nr:MafI family immunity protein [Neisseria meningitidis]MCL5867120.1 MafI family immunity protein [Neisseria meningitidis]MCL5871182.1 MafI family immunity protein [Neisseria meningitidis]MCL6114803.1 MafI family immunity protein [Neisseria meningitidis]
MKTLEKRMKALDKQMMKFGKSLEGRLDARLIESALDYIHYSERFLAFEILCTYIEDFDVQLTEQESREISFINKEFEIESTSD